MKNKKTLSQKWLAGLLSGCMAASLFAAVPVSVSADTDAGKIVNGDFEAGDFTGWTLMDGSAADSNNVGVVSSGSTYWGARSYYKQGNYFLDGAPREGEAGQIRSTTFTLGGEGYIAFLMGSAFVEGRGSVKLYQDNDGDDTLVKTYVNSNWADPATGNTLLRIYDHLPDMVGQKFYFVVENGAEAGFSFINVDDFRTSLTLAEVKALYAEDASRVKTVSDDYADHIKTLYKNVTFYGTDTEVGEGEAVRATTVTAHIAEEAVIKPGVTLNLTEMIDQATKVEDGFGFAADYTISFNSIMHDGEDLKDSADALTLGSGVYEVSYRISYQSEGADACTDLTYKITAEAAELTEDVPNGDFETGDFTGWTLMDGTPATQNNVGSISNGETYWGAGQKYYKQGTYFLDGTGREGVAGGQIRSGSFLLGGEGYISFMIGGAARESKGSVKVFAANADGEDTLIKTYTNPYWGDPKAGLTLIRFFDKLDEQYMGKELYFVIENGTDTSGFAFINADDFRASMTEADVRALQDEQLGWLAGISDPYSEYIVSCYRANGLFNDVVLEEDLPDTIEQYAGITVDLAKLIASNIKVVESYSLKELPVDVTVKSVSFEGSPDEGDPKALLLKEGTYQVTYTRSYGDVENEEKTLTVKVNAVDASVKEIENGGFETGDLTGWTVVTPNVWNTNEDGSFKGVVSAQTYWGEQLPYNQEGNYHLDGWEVAAEPDAWGLRSSVFTLGGSGFISLRMGGRAATVRVYLLDGTLIGTYNQTRFNDANFPFVNRGGSWADMGTYFINLSEYIDQPMYLVLHDAKTGGGWACAFFDDVKTFYETTPDVENGFDTVTGPVSEGLTYGDIEIPWTLLTNEPIRLSFEDGNYDVANAGGQKATAELASQWKDPAFQDEAVLPFHPDGVSGKALSLDGYSNFTEFNENFAGSQLTVDAYIAPRAMQWDNPGAARTDQFAQVVAGSYNTGEKTGFLLGITKHGYPAFRVGTGANWYSLTSENGKRVPLYQWSRITGVFNGETGVMEVYLNGELAGSMSVERGSEVVGTGRPIRIGKGSETIIVVDTSDGTMFPGLVDEISVKTTALDAEGVAAAGLDLPELDYEDARIQDDVLEGDYYRPTYHAVPPANWMNEPHGLFQYNGKWHLFYQTNQGGPFWRNISWGHWVSDDLVTWKCLKEAVVPTPDTVAPDGIWTGNVIFSSDGYPMLLITAGDDSRTVNGSNQHVGLVRAVDYDDPDLVEWEILGYCVAQTSEMGTPGEFRDAQCFNIGDERYMVVGGAKDGQGVAHTFKTNAGTLAEWESAVAGNALNGLNWTYMGDLFGDFFANHEYKQTYGTVWEMPNLAPLLDEDGNPTDKYLFVFSPQYGDNDVWYFIGSFDPETCRFTPDFEDAQLMDYGDNIFTGPTVYVNPSDGKVYICSIMQENAAGELNWTVDNRIAAGWAFYAGLVREVYLKKDGTLGIRPCDTSPIEGETLVSFVNKTADEANELLKAVDSDQIKIEFTFAGSASEVGFKLKNSEGGCSRFFITDSAMGLDNKSGAFAKKDRVSGVIYVDKASVEAYVDESKTVSGSKFFRGTGLEVFISGDAKCTVTVKEMQSIHGEITDYPETLFTDVADPDAWYYDAVYWAAKTGVTTGYGDNTFQPTAKLTRAQAVSFLYKYAGEPSVDDLPEVSFSDVKESDWFYSAVKWAVAKKITSGYGTGTFQPNASCTRAMIVTFISNYAKASGTYIAPAGEAVFSDVKAGDWFKGAVDWAVENGITSGYGQGTFQPNYICNRAMMVTFLKSYSEL